MNESQMMEYWCKLAASKLSSSEHKEMAENYDRLAKHYVDLAEEARKHAAGHRKMAAQC